MSLDSVSNCAVLSDCTVSDNAKLYYQFIAQLKSAKTKLELITLKRDWIGKGGIIKLELKKLASMPVEEKAEFAKSLNELQQLVAELIQKKLNPSSPSPGTAKLQLR